MSAGSSIEWTDATWNPVVGCTPVSPGCLNCYAATMAERLGRMGQARYVGLTVRRGENVLEAGGGRGRDVFNGTVRCLEDVLTKPLAWRKPRRVFVDSMSDLFHESVPFDFIDRVFAVMALCPQHTFQVLTKRPGRMAEYLNERRPDQYLSYDKIQMRADEIDANAMAGREWPLPNVWLGTSAERQEELDERVPHLFNCPAAVRFISGEPLLEETDLGAWLHAEPLLAPAPEARMVPSDDTGSVPTLTQVVRRQSGIHWVIVGGESGANARPCDLAWIRSVVWQCRAAGVPVFVKQLGTYPMLSLRQDMIGEHPTHADAPSTARAWKRGEYGERLKLRDRKGGDPDEWPEDLRVREFPEGWAPGSSPNPHDWRRDGDRAHPERAGGVRAPGDDGRRAAP